MAVSDGRPVPAVAHIVYQLSAGGMENGIINLVNRIPGERYRHFIVSLTECDDFQARIRNATTKVIALHKRPGKDLPAYVRLWRMLRELRPEIVYTHTMATLDVQVCAALAGVPGRIHGEHGQRSAGMAPGRPARSRMRRLAGPFVQRYTTVSRDLTEYLAGPAGIPRSQVTEIYNGVDIERFRPRAGGRLQSGSGFSDDAVVIGTVGRMETIKDQLTLTRAFLAARERAPELAKSLRLALVGDGPLREECRRLLAAAGAEQAAWLPGKQDGIPEILRTFDIFVLPSLSEGMSNTILEAMATGLPVVATNVGGNPELVRHEDTGRLIPAGDPSAMADAILAYAANSAERAAHGAAGRALAERRFALERMIDEYLGVYDDVLAQARRRRN